jgi:hypothetical protein
LVAQAGVVGGPAGAGLGAGQDAAGWAEGASLLGRRQTSSGGWLLWSPAGADHRKGAVSSSPGNL